MRCLGAFVVAFALAALLSTGAAAASAPGQEGVDLSFHGHVFVEGGAKVLGGSLGPMHIDGDQTGALDIPHGATRVTVALRPDEEPPLGAGLRLTLCEESCQERDGRVRLLAEGEGRSRVTLSLALPEVTALGWEVRVTDGALIDTPFTGTARFHLADDGVRTVPSEDPATSAAGTPRPFDLPPAIGMAAVAGAFATLLAGVRRRGAILPFLWLFHRVDDKDLLAHATRHLILETVANRPGIHFGELQRETGTARGNLDHHLRRMLLAGLLVEHRTPGYRCFFTPNDGHMIPPETASATRSPMAQAILCAVAARPGAILKDVSQHLGVPHGTVSYHVKRLEAKGALWRRTEKTATRLQLTDLGHRIMHRSAGVRASSKIPPVS